MNTRKTLVALAIAAVLGASPLITTANAADKSMATQPSAESTAPADATAIKPPVVQAGDDQSAAATPAQVTIHPDKAVIKTVEEASLAVREIHEARLALFEGMTDQAKTLVTDAIGKLDLAQASLSEHGLSANGDVTSSKDNGTRSKDANERYLPFDTSFSLAEGFVPAEQHREAMTQANEQMASGDQKGALQSLDLADVDVAVSAAMIPADSSLEQVKEAGRLLEQKDFHAANMALKSIEDSIVVETWSMHAIPTQGDSGLTQQAPAKQG